MSFYVWGVVSHVFICLYVIDVDFTSYLFINSTLYPVFSLLSLSGRLLFFLVVGSLFLCYLFACILVLLLVIFGCVELSVTG